MARHALVDERVVRRQQIDDAAVVANEAVEEQLGFALERERQRLIGVGKPDRIRNDLLEVLQPQPLRGESRGQRIGARVLQHPLHLLAKAARERPASPCAAGFSSSSSGPTPHRKNDSRDASS